MIIDYLNLKTNNASYSCKFYAVSNYILLGSKQFEDISLHVKELVPGKVF